VIKGSEDTAAASKKLRFQMIGDMYCRLRGSQLIFAALLPNKQVVSIRIRSNSDVQGRSGAGELRHVDSPERHQGLYPIEDALASLRVLKKEELAFPDWKK
jgi:hypothetical protein